MKVLVTGIGGKIGIHIGRDLLEAGHEVHGLDIKPPTPELRERLTMFYGNITDPHLVMRAMEGCDAVIHLAALTTPFYPPDSVVDINVRGTQHVLQAAEAHGVARYVQAGTICVYGFTFATHEIQPQFLPLDETHPQLPQDIYAVSKQCNELMAAGVSRRTGLSCVTLRLSHVVDFSHLPHWFVHSVRNTERRSHEFWSYVDVRDASRAFLCALSAELDGHEVFNIVAPDSLTTASIHELVAQHFPQFSANVAALPPDGGLVSNRLAAERLGFTAQHLWKENEQIAASLNDAA